MYAITRNVFTPPQSPLKFVAQPSCVGEGSTKVNMCMSNDTFEQLSAMYFRVGISLQRFEWNASISSNIFNVLI